MNLIQMVVDEIIVWMKGENFTKNNNDGMDDG
jgi:hypothetical protein